MKYLTKYMLAAVTAISGGAALSSCNDISSDDRYIELPAVEAKRVVLLEEFTGQYCVNCPEAHELIDNLLSQYPENLISVSIHGGPEGTNSIGEETQKPPMIGLRNADGANYTDAYKISAFPAGVVNRTTGVTTSDQWSAAIREAIAKPSDVDMTLSANLSDNGKKIEIKTEVSPYNNISANLQIWVVESGIEAIQRTRQGFKTDYIHNHVFRGAVNGINGEQVQLTTRQPQQFTHEATIKDIWNRGNLSIVAFLYNNSGVIQAVHAEVAPSEAN